MKLTKSPNSIRARFYRNQVNGMLTSFTTDTASKTIEANDNTDTVINNLPFAKSYQCRIINDPKMNNMSNYLALR